MVDKIGSASSPADAPRKDGARRAKATGRRADHGTIEGLSSASTVSADEFFEQLFESAFGAISIVDQDLRVVRVNGEFTQLFGFTSDEACGQGLDKLIVPPDRHAETAWVAESIRARSKISLETRRQRKDGSLVDVLVCASPAPLGGAEIGALACYRDISEQKRVEELNAALYAIAARSQPTEDLQQLFAALHHIVGPLVNARNFHIALYDPQTRFLSFPYFVDEKESAPEPQRLGRGLTEFVLRSARPLLGTPVVLADLVRRGEADLAGVTFVDWLGVPMLHGGACIGVLAVRSYNQDVRFGERDQEILTFLSQHLAAAIVHKRHQDALRLSEARSRSLILGAAFGICRCTPAGKLLDANPALINMLGHDSVESVLRLNARNEIFANPKDLDRLAEDCRQAGGLTGVELQWKRRDNGIITVRVSGCAAPAGRDGTNDGRAGDSKANDSSEEVMELMAEDITDRRQLEEQLRQSQKMDAIGRLAGGVAHDFNNLLMVINGYTEVLLEELEKGGDAHQKVRSIQQAADRAATLTRQLLAFSRKQLLELKVIDINTVVGDMERLLRPLIGENIELVTRLSSQTGRTRADAGQIEQVIMNLVVNAKDAMPRGGKLTLQSADVTVRKDFNEHRFIQPGRYAVISVSDTGHGMDKETQSRIFEPFFTTKEKGKGTGLGLSTVYGIVKQSNGHVFAQSQVGSGTTFHVYLPRIEESAEETSPAKSHPADIGGSETVLLVEDEAAVRDLVSETLNARGYKVLEADSGESGLQLAERCDHPIDILITDVVMPGISGRELAGKLLPLRPGMSVLFLSGYTEDTVIPPGSSGTTAAFLQKPFTLHNLAKKVREVLHARPNAAAMAKTAAN